MLRKFSGFIFISALFLAACSKEQSPPEYPAPHCNFPSVYYSPVSSDDPQSIQQIIRTNCGSGTGATCHTPGNGNYDFTTYEVVAERIRSGRLTERILLPTSNPLRMPPSGAIMDSCDLAKLIAWINNGFPNN
ncbi:MAG TPA: hypothetical protein VI757_15770 [Bacteroidia bacterium]|nr:hypothetical protein [Bacteroidia bacterium]